MKKKVLTLLLSVFAVATTFTLKAEATELNMKTEVSKMIAHIEEPMFAVDDEIEVIDAGYCGNSKVMWGITADGILVIAGSGAMPDYEALESPWSDYRDFVRAIVISGKVTYIGEYAFWYMDSVETLLLEDGIQKIGGEAFSCCQKLQSVEIPNSVTEICYGAFDGCVGMKTLKLSNKLKSIAPDSFSYCHSLKSVKIPNGVTKIGRAAFKNCSGLTSVEIPKSVTVIDYWAFEYCTSLTTFTFPATVKVISDGTFEGCTKLKTINIPSGVTTIEWDAFKDCTALEKIYLPDSITVMHSSAFNGCTKLKDVRLSNRITEIPEYAFENCKYLESISIPEGVNTIGESAFMGCYSLKYIGIPTSLKNIKAKAFSSCDNLENIRIPSTVTNIEKLAFEHCKKLSKVTILNTNVTLGTEVFRSAPNVIVRCLENSTAHNYAVKSNLSFELVDLSLVTECFDDVFSDWYTSYVQFVYDNHLMTGIKGTEHFLPNANITKAQVAQVLYNMEGQPEVENKNVFTELSDVFEAEWYGNAVAWAYENQIVTGDTNTMKFFPNADVTREQLALMMYRYASYKEYDVSAFDDLTNLVHAENVSNWAEEGVKWAVGAGLISGIDKNEVKDLAPQGNASRTQMAAILQRFCVNIALTEPSFLAKI